MPRHLVSTAIAAAALWAIPAAIAQEGMPELDGGPPPLQLPKPAPKPAPPAPKTAIDPLSAERARLARQAEAQKAEQIRLDRLAADLKAEQARLDARTAQIATEEERLVQLSRDQDAAYTEKLAELESDRLAARPPPAASQPIRPRPSRINYETARRACTRAGMDEALARDFYSARYDAAPRLFEREMRGLMRMDDRRGYLLVDTVCELDDDGIVLNFQMLR